VETANGRAALEMVRTVDESFDIVVTDIGSRNRCIELAGRLIDERPDLPVLLMSGYGAATALPFLQKLFAPDMLVQRLARYSWRKRTA
jgi:DNA-binding NtrC family response regulator